MAKAKKPKGAPLVLEEFGLTLKPYGNSGDRWVFVALDEHLEIHVTRYDLESPSEQWVAQLLLRHGVVTPMYAIERSSTPHAAVRRVILKFAKQLPAKQRHAQAKLEFATSEKALMDQMLVVFKNPKKPSF